MVWAMLGVVVATLIFTSYYSGGGEPPKASGKKAKASKPGANPFFKFVYADDKCIAARGRGGGLALWAREGDPETDANEA